MQDSRGVSDFEAVKTAIKYQAQRLIFYAFDLLHLGGKDVRDLPLLKRRAQLKELIASNSESPLQFREEGMGEGVRVLSGPVLNTGGGNCLQVASITLSEWAQQTWCFTESSLLIIGTDRDRKTGGMRATLARAEARGWWMQVQLSLACLHKRGRSWGIGFRLRSEAPQSRS